MVRLASGRRSHFGRAGALVDDGRVREVSQSERVVTAEGCSVGHWGWSLDPLQLLNPSVGPLHWSWRRLGRSPSNPSPIPTRSSSSGWNSPCGDDDVAVVVVIFLVETGVVVKLLAAAVDGSPNSDASSSSSIIIYD